MTEFLLVQIGPAAVLFDMVKRALANILQHQSYLDNEKHCVEYYIHDKSQQHNIAHFIGVVRVLYYVGFYCSLAESIRLWLQ